MLKTPVLSQHRMSSILLILVGMIFYYFGIIHFFNLSIQKDILFSHTYSDSLNYLNVSNWISHGTPTEDTIIRPIFYPLLISLFYQPFGAIGLWFIQFAFWLASGILIYYSILNLSRKKYLAYISLAIYCSNISLIALTFYGLTEITTTLICSLIALLCSIAGRKHISITHFHLFILLLSVGAITKPVFFPLLIVSLCLAVVFFQEYRKKPILLLVLLLSVAPVIGQVSIMKIKHDKLTISTISGYTFDHYLFSKGLQKIKNIDPQTADLMVDSISGTEKRAYMMNNPGIFFNAYLSSLIEDIKAEPFGLSNPINFWRMHHYWNFMKTLNAIFFYIHLLFLGISGLTFVIFIISKKFQDLPNFLLLASLTYFIFFTAGISFGQGDRLIVFAIPLWLVLYMFLINYWIDKLTGNNLQESLSIHK